MTKRIAIQLYGHMRTFAECAPYFFKNVVAPNAADGYAVDIFIHTWDVSDHNTVSWRSDGATAPVSGIKQQNIINAYHPVDISITPQVNVPELIISEKLGTQRSIRGPINMSFTLAASSELRRKHGRKYDWVIVTRPDVLFLKPFRIDAFLSAYDTFHLSIPDNAIFYAHNPYRSDYWVSDARLIAASDCIFFATPRNIDIAASLYDKIDDNIDTDNFYSMEHWFFQWLTKCKLSPVALRYHYGEDWVILYQKEVDNIERFLYPAGRKYKLFNRITVFMTRTTDIKKYYYLFNNILVLVIKKKPATWIYRLFGLIPVWFHRVGK